ncbi:MAG: tetratricopeptide repeat protein [Flavisolibacter sp.]|nr:tetratricopeptide repeat protein [Flavisolibacter sp.]
MPQTRQLAAIMFTDIAGYTALMDEDEQKALQLLEQNRAIQKPLIEQHGGKWIKELGDGVLASFPSTVDAVSCACAINQTCEKVDGLRLRIGIHLGDVVFENNDVFGDGVNIASRLQALAPIGSIWISEAVYKTVSNKKEIQTRFVREEVLKHVKEPMRIYEVTTEKTTAHLNQSQSRPIPSVSKTFYAAHNKRKRLFLIGIIICLLVAMSFGYWFFTGSNGKQIESIAVLPFVNTSGIADVEYLSDGITESLINSLSQLPHLSVKARSSVFHYKGKEVTPQVVGKELKVQAVLNGRMVQRGDQLTLSLDLVEVSTGNQLWGERYMRKQTELVSLQSEIARDVANKLRARLSGTDEQRVTKTYTADPEAYQLYLRGLYHWNKRTAEDIRKSIVFFQQAIDKDPSYARAYAGLAMAYLVLPEYSRNMTKQELKEVDLKRRAAVHQAQELDDSLAEVHAVLATLKVNAWDFPAAENEYRQAIKLNRNFSSAHSFYSRLLGGLGRYEEAFTEINKAHELDPFSVSINFNIGGRFYDARRFDEAIAQFKKVLEMEPNHPLTHLVLARTYDAKGLYPEAIAEYRKGDVLLEKETPETAQYKAAALTQALKAAGAPGYWRKRLELSQHKYDEGRGSAYEIAVSYARLGDRAGVFGQLDKSFTAHELDLTWIKTESAFDAMASDPHFRDLLRRIGLPE